MSGFDHQRLAHLAEAMRLHVEQDRVGGAEWLLAASDQVEVGVAGKLSRGEPTPVLYRIAAAIQCTAGRIPCWIANSAAAPRVETPILL